MHLYKYVFIKQTVLVFFQNSSIYLFFLKFKNKRIGTLDTCYRLDIVQLDLEGFGLGVSGFVLTRLFMQITFDQF